jgi:hypothetical protein
LASWGWCVKPRGPGELCRKGERDEKGEKDEKRKKDEKIEKKPVIYLA